MLESVETDFFFFFSECFNLYFSEYILGGDDYPLWHRVSKNLFVTWFHGGHKLVIATNQEKKKKRNEEIPQVLALFIAAYG